MVDVEKYISNTKLPKDLHPRYGLYCDDVEQISKMANGDMARAFYKAFLYGRAKGYRIGKKEQKNKSRRA